MLYCSFCLFSARLCILITISHHSHNCFCWYRLGRQNASLTCILCAICSISRWQLETSGALCITPTENCNSFWYVLLNRAINIESRGVVDNVNAKLSEFCLTFRVEINHNHAVLCMKEFFFFSLQTLAEGLRMGEIEWLEPLETRSAVDLTRALIEGNPSHHYHSK